jgi:hypothetical protein
MYYDLGFVMDINIFWWDGFLMFVGAVALFMVYYLARFVFSLLRG